MKLAVIAIIVAMAAGSANPANIYNEGNAKYKAGDYEGALALYNSISAVNPDLEYNRGAAYLKTGRLGKATVHFHRALKLRPGDKDSQASLEYIRSVKADREKQERSGVLERMIVEFRRMFSVNALFGATLAFLYLTSVVAALFFLGENPARGRLMAIFLAALTVMTIMSGVVTAVVASYAESRDIAVAVEKSVDAFAEPSDKSDKLFTFHEATTCRLGRSEGQYVFVALESGISGWVESAKLDTI